MRKYLIILVAVWLNAGLLNAIAVVVNGIAITMYDIDKTANANNLSQKQAIKKLIDDILYKQELEKIHKSNMEKEAKKEYKRKLAERFKEQTPRGFIQDLKRKAKPAGRRISKNGNVYYEYRKNRTDTLGNL